MLKYVALAAGLMLASAATAQQSLRNLHARVPAPPVTAAAASAWLVNPALVALRQQIKDQRKFVEGLGREAGAAAQPAAAQTGGSIDFQRAARDPEYAEQVRARIAAMSPEEQRKIAMQFSQANSQSALKDAQAMAAESEAVATAAAHYPDYHVKQMTAHGIEVQQAAVDNIRQRVSARELEITDRTIRALKCSDGEGSCSAADQAADKATLRAGFDQIIAEYDKVLPVIAQQVEAARKSRLVDIIAAERDLAPAQYGRAAQSNTNRQLLVAYHNAVLMEVEQLLALSEDSAKWAAARFKDRSVNFHKID